MPNEIQEIILKQLDEFKRDNTRQHEEIMSVFNRSDKEQQGQIDDHCLRLREAERRLAVQDAEFAPIKRAYNNLTSFMVGFFIVVGAMFIGALYFLKDKLK